VGTTPLSQGQATILYPGDIMHLLYGDTVYANGGDPFAYILTTTQ